MDCDTRRPVVYVAGPYSNDPKTWLRKAIRGGFEVFRAGGAPIVPHLSHYAEEAIPIGYDAWLEIDLAIVEICDAVYRLPGESLGAEQETMHAQMYEIPVLAGLDAMKNWVQEWSQDD